MVIERVHRTGKVLNPRMFKLWVSNLGIGIIKALPLFKKLDGRTRGRIKITTRKQLSDNSMANLVWEHDGVGYEHDFTWLEKSSIQIELGIAEFWGCKTFGMEFLVSSQKIQPSHYMFVNEPKEKTQKLDSECKWVQNKQRLSLHLEDKTDLSGASSSRCRWLVFDRGKKELRIMEDDGTKAKAESPQGNRLKLYDIIAGEEVVLWEIPGVEIVVEFWLFGLMAIVNAVTKWKHYGIHKELGPILSQWKHDRSPFIPKLLDDKRKSVYMPKHLFERYLSIKDVGYPVEFDKLTLNHFENFFVRNFAFGVSHSPRPPELIICLVGSLLWTPTEVRSQDGYSENNKVEQMLRELNQTEIYLLSNPLSSLPLINSGYFG
ncbi:PREDICTED: uncharacterized protein LOC104768566 isoform X1 [Camelina sativa]|uniref:Uncharacterized protein LOC104768566 isoform X1 n=1 Tax=Camelina sativa TaxID=90675 RepID=A0ABM1RFW8_CAMSA|nr:PREDICTED: uncharacterized protein LOC104768566 isoform X1 [Camelina sativa]XP_019097907.1 PREDICTED: uncharacterized protein LOC104768566 isoform X1 [Camelina sativa]